MMIRFPVALACLTLIAALGATTTHVAEAQGPRCDDYMRRAVEQNRENERLGCGFTGSRWHDNGASHFAWCMGASEGARRNETHQREQALERCRDRRTGGDRRFCNGYADAAVARNRQNERLGCGFSGSRWQSDRGNHFDWCMRVSRERANRESQARTRQINDCRDRRGTPSQRAFCNGYADTAVARNRQNERLGCGFSGSRWQSDRGNHFDWCMRVTRERANRETQARTRQIDNCRDRRGAGRGGACDVRDAQIIVRSPGCTGQTMDIPFAGGRMSDGDTIRLEVNSGVITEGSPRYGVCNFHTDLTYRCDGGRLVIDQVHECRQNRSGARGATCIVAD